MDRYGWMGRDGEGEGRYVSIEADENFNLMFGFGLESMWFLMSSVGFVCW